MSAPTINQIASPTTTSFRTYITQPSLPSGARDDFYVTNEYPESEPNMPNVTLTSDGHSYVDFNNLQPGTLYWVTAWRHLSDGSSSRSTTDFSTYDEDCFYTQPSTCTPYSTETWVEDWSNGISKWVCEAPFKQQPLTTRIADGNISSRYLHIGDVDLAIKTRRIWPNTDSFSAECQVRAGARWGSLTVLSSESSYIQVAWEPGGIAYGQVADTTSNTHQVSTGVTITPGSTHLFRIEFDGNHTWRIYIDSIIKATLIYAPPVPFGLWIGSGLNDYGTITVQSTGDPLWGFTDTGYVRHWSGTNHGTRWGMEEGWAGGGDFFANAGGLQIRSVVGDTMSFIGYWGTRVMRGWKDSVATYSAGTFIATSELIYVPSGYRYSTMDFTGIEVGSDEIRIRVKDSSGVLVPDSELPGNATGFLVNSMRSVSLLGVTGPTRIEVSGTNTRTTPSPSVLQYLGISFTKSGFTTVNESDHVALSWTDLTSGEGSWLIEREEVT